MRALVVAALVATALSSLAGCSAPPTASTAPTAAVVVRASSSPSTAAATPRSRKLVAESAADILSAWKAAGLTCSTMKKTSSLYATEVIDCGKNTTFSYFASASALKAQDKALRTLGKQGFVKELVLQGSSWTIQSTTKHLKKAKASFGGELTDGAHAGL